MEISGLIKDELLQHGADLVGFANLTDLPAEARKGFPVGVAVAVKYPKEVIRGIYELPTAEYYAQYNRLNEQLDELVNFGAAALQAKGYRAAAQMREDLVWDRQDFSTPLPHKTVALRAGLGWIGKSALLVTKEYGSMVRLSSILTDAPLQTANPEAVSRCGNCHVCTEACPAGAVQGRLWQPGGARDDIFDAAACHTVANERSLAGFGVEATICGRCILVCPHTQRYLNAE